LPCLKQRHLPSLLAHLVLTLRLCSIKMSLMYKLLPFLALIVAQKNMQDSVASFCRRQQHRARVIAPNLQVDGGEVCYGGEVDGSSQPVMSKCVVRDCFLQLIIKIHGCYGMASTSSSRQTPGVPLVCGGVLWPGTVNKFFYLLGGEYETGRSIQ
jgi:hypothetical protein